MLTGLLTGVLRKDEMYMVCFDEPFHWRLGHTNRHVVVFFKCKVLLLNDFDGGVVQHVVPSPGSATTGTATQLRPNTDSGALAVRIAHHVMPFRSAHLLVELDMRAILQFSGQSVQVVHVDLGLLQASPRKSRIVFPSEKTYRILKRCSAALP